MGETETDDTTGSSALGEPDSLDYQAPDDAVATILTNGDPIRSFVNSITEGVDVSEARITLGSDGLACRVVDAPNVLMGDISFPADGLSRYDPPSDDITIGAPLAGFDGPDLQSVLAYARRGRGSQSGDPVRIDVLGDDADRLRVAILRPDQQARRVTEFFTIDPDSMRPAPDFPDMGLVYRADPSVEAFSDAVNALDAHDHAWFAADSRTFIVGTQATANPHLDPDDTDLAADTISFPNRAWSTTHPDGKVDDAEGSLFSRKYLRDIAAGVQAAKADRLTVSFDDELPAMVSFDTTDWGLTGRYMVAPRLPDDDD